MKKEYFNIVFGQLKLNLDYTPTHEYLIADKMYIKQMEKIIEYLTDKDIDVLILPEMSYHKNYDEFFIKYSFDKIIVFGSVYCDSANFTVVFNNGEKHLIKKMFNSALEPSIKYGENITIKNFIKNHLSEHTFVLHNKKFIVLNCAEYYKVAYYIARDCKLSKNLFGFLVPCANNNNDVFVAESIAIHNHNDNIYSFVVNCSSLYKGKKYSYGGSYVFGRISAYEKENSNISQLNHPSNICSLSDDSYLVDGMYLFADSSRYYRSDNFKHTPLNIKINKIAD